jgi:DNA repair protein RadC
MTTAPATKSYRDTITQWPEGDRPRERLLRYGPRVLSDAELISAIIGSGGPEKNAVALAREIIQKAGGLDKVCRLTEPDCQSIAWFGPMKLAQTLAAIELGKRALYCETKQALPPLDSSEDVYRLLLPRLSGLKGERFITVFGDGQNRYLADEVVSEGSVTQTPWYSREVINLANKHAAAALILAHNHLSGDLSSRD